VLFELFIWRVLPAGVDSFLDARLIALFAYLFAISMARPHALLPLETGMEAPVAYGILLSAILVLLPFLRAMCEEIASYEG